jgi:proteasome lid subunit RPN8/RPN11
MLIIKLSDFQIICQQAEETYPEECCGLLLGKINSKDKIVSQVYPTENVWTLSETQQLFANQKGENLSKKNRFAISPKAMLKAQKVAVEQKWTVIAIYHSHPDHPAIPSDCDHALAWEQYSYIIMSVDNGKVTEYRSWFLGENRQFTQEKILISY